MRLNPFARLAVLAAVLGLTACDLGTTSGDGSAGNVAIAIPMRFASSANGTVAAQERAENNSGLDRIEAKIVVKRTGEVVLEKTLTEGSPEVQDADRDDVDPTVTLRFRIPQDGDAEVFTLTLAGFLNGVQLYSIGPVDFTLGSDGRSATVQAQATYVGPGSNVTGVVLSPRSITLQVNQTATFACAGTPGNVSNFPYEVETDNPAVASVQTISTIRGGMVGTTQLVCRLGFGSRAEDRIPVTVTGGPTLTIVSGGGQNITTGQTLPNPVVVQAKNGDGSNASGVVVTFAPFANHGTANPTSGTTNSAGQASTSWTVGTLTGTQTLRASAVVQGQNVSVDVTAQVGGGGGTTGSVSGTVQSNNGSPISGATVELRSGTNNTSGAALQTVTSAANGGFSFTALTPGAYTLRGSASTFSDGTANVTITAGANTSATITLTAALTGAIAGTVTNAQTGLPLANATVEVRNGTSVTTGTPVATTTTNAQGTFNFQNRIAGPYTVRATASGFADAFFNLTVNASQTSNAPLSLSPVQSAGQVRIVVTWANLLDLDSHLFVPQGPNSPIVVFWNSPYRTDSGCLLTNSPFACLEHDAVPPSDLPTESTRIGQVLAGTYSFYVHNYTADSEERPASDNSLATSGVKVDVYVGASSTATASFTVPNAPGNLWHVFNMSLSGGNPVFTPANSVSQVDLASPPQSGNGANAAALLRQLKGPIRPIRQ